MTYGSSFSTSTHPEVRMQDVASELIGSFDLKWQHLTLAQDREEDMVVEGAWYRIKRQVVAALGPSGFSVLARALEMSGDVGRKPKQSLTQHDVTELLIALELCATPHQRALLTDML